MGGTRRVLRAMETRQIPRPTGISHRDAPRGVKNTENPREAAAGALTSPRRLAWADPAAREPRLTDFLAEARRERPDGAGRACAKAAWFWWHGRPGIKARLPGLVGWHADGT